MTGTELIYLTLIYNNRTSPKRFYHSRYKELLIFKKRFKLTIYLYQVYMKIQTWHEKINSKAWIWNKTLHPMFGMFVVFFFLSKAYKTFTNLKYNLHRRYWEVFGTSWCDPVMPQKIDNKFTDLGNGSQLHKELSKSCSKYLQSTLLL